jgi:predicted porin
MNKKILAVAISGAMIAPMAAQAVKYKLSGQVNRAVVFQDDGEQSGVRHVDAISSGTRFRLKGSEDIGNGMKVGFAYESQWSSSKSYTQRPDLNGDGSGGSGTLRQGNVWFSGNWGKLTLGQTDGAGNGATESDWVPSGSYHGRTSFTGGLRWRTSGGGTLKGKAPGTFSLDEDTGVVVADPGATLTESSTFNEYDAFSRHDVIRYDSPKLGPVTLAASIGNDSVWEVAMFGDADIGGGNLLFAAFYGEDGQGVRSGGTDDRWGGSLRYQFAQGTKISGTYAENENTSDQSSDVFTVGIGHSWGNNTISTHYSQASDVTQGYDDEAWNIGFDHNIPKAKTNVYASFFHTELDTPAGVASVEDHNTFVVGARVKFN